MKTQAIFAGFALGAVLVGTVFATADTSSPPAPAAHTSPLSELRSLKGVAAPDAWQAKNMSVLARSAVAGDQPDPAVVSPSSRHAGVAAGTQRLVATVKGASAGPDNVYLSPASAGVCFDSTSYLFAGCVGDDEVAKGSVQSAICSPYLDPNKIALYGAFPDGVDHVTLKLADDTTKDVPVSHNVYALLLDKSSPLVQDVSWTLPGGTVQSTSPVPPDAATGQCASATPPAAATAELRKMITSALN